MEEWAACYETDIPQISWLMYSLNGNNHLYSWMNQGSIVNIEIRCDHMKNIRQIRPKLLLDVR